MARAVIVLVSLLVISAAPSVSAVSGVPSVTDGDTLKVGRERIRLHGIDAPESKQTCRVGDQVRTGGCGAVGAQDGRCRRS